MRRSPPRRLRSYRLVLRRLERAVRSIPGGRLIPIGEAAHGGRRYPLMVVALTTGPVSRRRGRLRAHRPPINVCLGAGIHGDEPAGVEAALRWLERLPSVGHRLPAANVLIFPCINPSGYERNRRTNHDGIDLNRQYKNPRAPIEVRAVRRALAGATALLPDSRSKGRTARRFDLSVEFHEDVDSAGFYLYELIDRRRPMGRPLIAAAARRLPINHSGEIEGADAEAGIIHRNRSAVLRRRSRWPHALYLFHHGTPHCLTFETPVTVPLSRRSETHADLFTLALRLGAWGHRRTSHRPFRTAPHI